jgi:hypothetical protein
MEKIMQTEIITTQISVPVQIKDKASQLKKQIFDKLREVSSDPEMFDEFIRFINRFHNYSMYNRILIFIQRRDSSQVAGYRTWQSFNRQVKKNETGILIFAPKIRKIKSDDGSEEELCLTGFRTVSVFDYNQTAPIDPDSDDIKIPSFGRIITDNPEVLYEKLKDIAMNSGLQVIETNMEFSKAGSTNGKVIKINRLTGSDAKCATILHETGHALLRHLDDRKEIPRHTKEVEAELTSFLVGLSIGLPKGNYEYIKSWLRDDVLTDEAIDMSIKTSDKIISLINNVKEPTIN